MNAFMHPCGAAGRCGVLVLLLFGAAAQAQGVYKCRDARGGIAYQDRACAAGATQSEVELAPPPPLQPSPDYHRDVPARTAPRTRIRREARPALTMSHECRTADGEVFYRHGGCPKSLAGNDVSAGARRGRGSATTAVFDLALPRAEVCRRLAARGRAAHARDERVSTYERNAGRDPCR